MSEINLAQSSDKATIQPPLSDAQVGNAVATKFLTEINQGMTLKPDSTPAMNQENSAYQDLERLSLNSDPQQKAVLNAIAGKVENHDPAMGILQGTVERDSSGGITGFKFENPPAEAAYAQKLNTYMAAGHTLQEAIADDGTNFFDQDNIRGTVNVPATGYDH